MFLLADAPEFQKRSSIMTSKQHRVFLEKSANKRTPLWLFPRFTELPTHQGRSCLLLLCRSPIQTCSRPDTGPNSACERFTTKHEQKGSIHAHFEVSRQKHKTIKLNQAVSWRNKHMARRSKGDNALSSGYDDGSDD